MERYVVTISIESNTTTWLRSLCVETPPPLADLEFYYKHLCGFEDAIITCATQTVPSDFNESLLTVSEATQFPVSNVEADTEDTERIGEYFKYIEQVCTMERSRKKLAVDRKPVKEGVPEKGPIVKRRKWVED